MHDASSKSSCVCACALQQVTNFGFCTECSLRRRRQFTLVLSQGVSFLDRGDQCFFVYDKKLPRARCLLNLLSINKQQVSISRCWLVKALHRGIFEESVIQVIWDLGRLLHEARRQDLQHWRLEDRVGCHVGSDVQSVDAQSVNLKKSATYCVTVKLSTDEA